MQLTLGLLFYWALCPLVRLLCEKPPSSFASTLLRLRVSLTLAFGPSFSAYHFLFLTVVNPAQQLHRLREVGTETTGASSSVQRPHLAGLGQALGHGLPGFFQLPLNLMVPFPQTAVFLSLGDEDSHLIHCSCGNVSPSVLSGDTSGFLMIVLFITT